MEQKSLSVFDYSGKKVCDLYDSTVQTPGQAFDISVTTELSGWKTLNFTLPYLVKKDDAAEEDNWRWRYIKAEYQVRLKEGNKEDWFIITSPKKSKSSKKINGTVECGHLSGTLKTKNLYLYFDDTNGIGTLPYLMNQILAGTAWTFDEDGSDVFYENYATDESAEKVEKKRSLSSDSKAGAYSLIASVCDLFNAYPVYDAVNKKVACFDLNNKKPLWEMEVGKNLTALSKESNSENIVTRLYVEGDYDEKEYVGIDDVNPTGLSYLMNFDYYKSIGAFTDAHQAALDKYMTDIKAIKKETMATATDLSAKSSELSLLWGSVNYVLWTVKDGTPTEKYIGGTVETAQESFEIGDTMYVFTNDGKYTTQAVTADTKLTFASNVTHILKFIGKCNGSIGAKEVAIEAKQQTIDELEKENAKETTSEATKAKNNETINAIRASIQGVYNGTGEIEKHAYTVKVTGAQELQNGTEVEAELARTSTSVTLNTASYKLSSTDAALASDKTVVVNANDVKFSFGDYGITDALAESAAAAEIKDKSVHDLPANILNVSSVAKKIQLKCSSNSTGVVATLYGTTFTMTVSAVAYGLYEQFARAVKLATEIGILSNTQKEQIKNQNNIEADFVLAMGDLLRDGYWNDDNYIKGQEQYLYNDALDVMKEVSKPTVKYTVSLMVMSDAMGYTPGQVELNSKVRIYDPELEINDTVYVNKIKRYIDRKDQGSVEITNEEVNISANFDSIFSRITSIANLIEQKKTLFERSEAITSEGTLATERLNGAIDLLVTRLSSSVSSWYTDDNGNIIFESVDGSSAMQLCGDGWMIADGKKEDGNWNWRTAASGKGIVADAIYTGYLSAERIEAGSITASKLASDVGKSLDLSSNESVRLTVKDAVDSMVTYQLKITSDNGLFFSKSVTETTLTADVYANGENVTKKYDASKFKWLRSSGDDASDAVWNAAHIGMRSITLTNTDVPVSATFECQITIDVDEDLSRLYFDTVAVANLTDEDFRFYLSSNAPVTQVYDPNLGGGYTPDWAATPVEIEPYIFLYGTATTPGVNNAIVVTWKKMVGSTETALGSYEAVDASTGKLTINGNVLGADSVTYICAVSYNGETMGQDSLSFTQVVAAEKTKSCVLSGGNVFKYTDGVVNPNSQTIACSVVNVTIVEWQYRQADGSYAKVPGSGTGSTLTVNATDENLFVNDICTIKVITSDNSVYDIFSLYKVRNGATGDAGTSYYAYIRYSAYADGRQMKEAPTVDTKYIGSYAGPSETVPPYTAFKWSKYVGSDITVESTLVEYNQVSAEKPGRPDDDDAGWNTEVPTLTEGYFLWARTTVTFSDKSTMRTYSVSYNGKTGATGVSYYTYVRYSANADGSSMTRLPEKDTAYIGIYTGTASSAPIAYSAYTWSRLKGDAGTGVTVSSTVTKYAKTDRNEQPAEDSALWQDDIPSVTEGSYLWSKTMVTYSDGTTATTYNVSYSGTNGENTAHAFLTNESISFAAGDDGKVGYTRIVPTVVAYVGITKTIPVVDFTKITNIPDGMVISSGGTTEDGEVELVIQVTAGSYLGAEGLISGQIGIPVQVDKDGVVLLSTTLYLSWVKLNKGKDGTNGRDGVMFSLYTPDGNTFPNGQGTLSIAASAYLGTTDLAKDSTATFTWGQFKDGQWVAMTETTPTISVSGASVDGIGVFRCVMTYKGESFTATETLTDKTDSYQAYIASSGGDTFVNGGSSSLSCLLYKNGEKVELDDTEYVWSKLDKDGNAETYSKTGKTITVSATEISEKATFICQVGGVQAQFTLRVSNDIYVSDIEPENPSNDMLWLDTSGDISVLKRWMTEHVDAASGETIAAHWEECTVSQSTIMNLQKFRTTTATELAALKASVEARVTTEKYDADTKILEQKIAEATMNDDRFKIMFSRTVEDGINSQIGSVANDLNNYKGSVANYMQFGSDGVLTLGSSQSDFKTQITNRKVAFMQGSSEVAYISDSSMFITNARVTQQLSIGTDNGNGYFDWTVTPTGLGLKWRDPSNPL